jgi:hypothetical protein
VVSVIQNTDLVKLWLTRQFWTNLEQCFVIYVGSLRQPIAQLYRDKPPQVIDPANEVDKLRSLYATAIVCKSFRFPISKESIKRQLSQWRMVLLRSNACRPVYVHLHFGGTYHLRVQCWRASKASSQHEAVDNSCLAVQPWKWRYCVPPKCRWTYAWLHRFISQKLHSL